MALVFSSRETRALLTLLGILSTHGSCKTHNPNSAQPQLIIQTIAQNSTHSLYLWEWHGPNERHVSNSSHMATINSEEYSYSKVSNYTKLEDCAALKVLRELWLEG